MFSIYGATPSDGMPSTTCKAETVAAATQPNLFHHQAAPASLALSSPLSFAGARTVGNATAMDAGRSQIIPSAEQDQALPPQPLSPNMPAFSLVDRSRQIQKEHQDIVESRRRDQEELDRVVRRASRLRLAREQYMSKLEAHRSPASETFTVQSAPAPHDAQAHTPDGRSEHSSHGSTSFLSLPPHIRSRIYSYLLTDQRSPTTVVHIERQLQLPCYKLTRPLAPTLSYRLSPQPKSPNTTSILLTNKEIYSEAIPILYADKIFYPHDLEGLLLLFLNSLSSYARSCIRSIRLPAEPPGSGAFNARKARAFHWAITCAQVAKLNDTLRTLEIYGRGILEPGVSVQYMFHPLCKIKAEKRLIHPENLGLNAAFDAEVRFVRLLRQAEEFLRSNAKIRAEKTKADARERAEKIAREEKERELVKEHLAAKEKAELEKKAQESENPLSNGSECVGYVSMDENGGVKTHPQDRLSLPQWKDWPKVSPGEIEQDLSKVKGLNQFEKELAALEELEGEGYEVIDRMIDLTDALVSDAGVLEDWDIVSVRSGGSPETDDGGSDDEWQDTASTLVGNEQDDNGCEKKLHKRGKSVHALH